MMKPTMNRSFANRVTPMLRKALALGVLIAVAWAVLPLSGLPFAALRAQDTLVIAAGETTSGEVANRFGEEWTFQGCVGDVITLRATSDEFTPFLALSDSSGETLVEGAGDAATQSAEIADFALPVSGAFTVLAAGSSILDRGAYSLTLESSAGSSAVALDLPLLVAGDTVTGEVTNRFGAELLFNACANDQVTITLESDDFAPRFDLFGPTGRSPLVSDAATGNAPLQLIAFTLPDSGLHTLIVAGATTSDLGAFALAFDLVAGPPVTPTPTPTATPAATDTPLPTATFTPSPTPLPTATFTPVPPTATPTPALAQVLQPQGIPIQVNGGDGDLLGEIFLNPNHMISAFEEGDTIVVGDRFYLELFVFDIREGLFNGAGIDRVEFEFFCPNGGTYTRVEQSPRYCSFSDGGGSCNVLVLQSGGYIPGTDCQIVNDYFEVNVTAYPDNENLTPGNWNFNLRPEIP